MIDLRWRRRLPLVPAASRVAEFRAAVAGSSGAGLAFVVALGATAVGMLLDRRYRRRNAPSPKPEPITSWENEGGAVPPAAK